MKHKRSTTTLPAEPPNWMRNYMLEKADPWERIEARLFAAEDFLNEARWIFFDVHKWAFLRKETFLKAEPPTNDLKQNLIHHLNVALDLLPKIQEGIKAREFNAYFVWLWGTFVEAVSIVEALTPYYEQIAPTEKKSYEDEKFDEKRWFALWYLHHKAEIEADGQYASRESIANKVEESLRDLWIGKLDPRKEFSKQTTKLLRNMASNEKDIEWFTLSLGFRDKLDSDRLKLFIKDVQRDTEGLPPVGNDLYSETSDADCDY